MPPALVAEGGSLGGNIHALEKIVRFKPQLKRNFSKNKGKIPGAPGSETKAPEGWGGLISSFPF